MAASNDGLLYCSVCQRADGHGSEPWPSEHSDTHIPAVRVVVCRVLKGAGLEIKVTEGRGQQG